MHGRVHEAILNEEDTDTAVDSHVVSRLINSIICGNRRDSLVSWGGERYFELQSAIFFIKMAALLYNFINIYKYCLSLYFFFLNFSMQDAK